MAKGPNPKHTSCRRGTVVIVKTIQGKTIRDIFLSRSGGTIHLKHYGRVKKSQMRSFQVDRNTRKLYDPTLEYGIID